MARKLLLVVKKVYMFDEAMGLNDGLISVIGLKCFGRLTAYARRKSNSPCFIMPRNTMWSGGMNVYTHISFDDAEEELKRMEEFEKKNDAKAVSQKTFKVV